MWKDFLISNQSMQIKTKYHFTLQPLQTRVFMATARHTLKLVLSLEVTGLFLAMRVSSYEEEWLHFPASFAARCGQVSSWISKPCTCFSLAASWTINIFKTWFQTGSHVQSPRLWQQCEVEHGIILRSREILPAWTTSLHRWARKPLLVRHGTAHS